MPAFPPTVTVQTAGVTLAGDLTTPSGAEGLVVFAHGSGSSRLSPRNRYVAAQLNHAGLATLLLDLLTSEEEDVDRVTRQYRFDIPRLAERLAGAITWARRRRGLADLRVGLFGASTGAAAALIAAAQAPDDVAAVVSRGGRPDLAGDALPHVRAPVLLIVGGDDTEVLALNRDAAARMPGNAIVHVVPGAGHLFEEPGALDHVNDVATLWFRRHLAGDTRERLDHGQLWQG